MTVLAAGLALLASLFFALGAALQQFEAAGTAQATLRHLIRRPRWLLAGKGFTRPVEPVSCGIDLGRFQPGDVKALARHLDDLLRSPGLRATMGAASRAIALTHDHQASLARFEAIYRKVAR